MAEKRNLVRAGFGLLGLSICWVVIKALPHLQHAGIPAIILGFIVFKVGTSWVESQMDRKIREEKRAIRGAKGEERLEGILDQLDETHVVFHDVVSQYGNIDHIVVAETGVFLIETKAHGGRVSVVTGELLVNGHPPEKDFIGQTLRNTYWLKEQILKATGIEPWINPVIVFTNAFVELGRPIKGVTVTNKKFLLKTIERVGRRNGRNSEVWSMRDRLTSLAL